MTESPSPLLVLCGSPAICCERSSLESGSGRMGTREEEIRGASSTLRVGARETARRPSAPWDQAHASLSQPRALSRRPGAGLGPGHQGGPAWESASSQRTAGRCCQGYLTAFGVLPALVEEKEGAEQSGGGRRGVSLGSFRLAPAPAAALPGAPADLTQASGFRTCRLLISFLSSLPALPFFRARGVGGRWRWARL